MSRCGCPGFRLCTAADAARLALRLPRGPLPHYSPWRTYLAAVYGEPVGDRFDASALEVWYPRLLPDPGCGTVGTHACSEAHCDSWLGPAPTAQEVAEHLRNRSFVRSRARGAEFVLSQSAARRAARAGAWLEVVRRVADSTLDPRTHAPLFPEGSSSYGCWFLAARGSGIFVRVGRTLGFETKDDAMRAFGRHREGRHPDDLHFAHATRSRGYHSLQVLRGNALPFGAKTAPAYELVVATAPCMDSPHPLPSGCVPVETRTGRRASRPCLCDHSNRTEVLNCAAAGDTAAGAAAVAAGAVAAAAARAAAAESRLSAAQRWVREAEARAAAAERQVGVNRRTIEMMASQQV